MDDGLIPEKERELISDRADLEEVTAEDPDEAYRQTLAQSSQPIQLVTTTRWFPVGTPEEFAHASLCMKEQVTAEDETTCG